MVMAVGRSGQGPASVLPYDPGSLPTRPAPNKGEVIVIEVDGLPPPKDIRISIRNARHPNHFSFQRLRTAATSVMAGRAWVFGAVKLRLTIFGPDAERRRPIFDHLAGVSDTLDGSTGQTFTYLPIVFEDDCQIVDSGVEWVDSTTIRYKVEVTIL
jgi:hypothetical protein